MHSLEKQIHADWSPSDWSDVTVLLAVSGGADSVALLRAIVALREDGPGKVCVAHLNHGLRGKESDRDGQFVRGLAGQHDLPYFEEHADTTELARQSGDGIEAAARQLRYDFLRRTAEQIGARFVVTAHTADDQVETILHHILRGTGLAGLGGIRRVRRLGPAVSLIRPMLKVHRQEILDYLDSLGQTYREDHSNRDPAYMRNRIRHKLLPLLREEYNGRVDDALLRLGMAARESQELLGNDATRLVDECTQAQTDGAITVDCSRLAQAPELLIRETLKTAWRQAGWPMQAMDRRRWKQLAEMVISDQPDVDFPGGIHATCHDEELRLSRAE